MFFGCNSGLGFVDEGLAANQKANASFVYAGVVMVFESLFFWLLQFFVVPPFARGLPFLSSFMHGAKLVFLVGGGSQVTRGCV